MTFKEFCKELLEEYGYIIFQYDSVMLLLKDTIIIGNA